MTKIEQLRSKTLRNIGKIMADSTMSDNQKISYIYGQIMMLEGSLE